MTASERILLVESNPDISDLVARQALQPMGYQVTVVGDAASAIQQAVQISPELVIANLNLPGLSGKDLLVALSSEGVHAPLIVIAKKGQEQDVIQAFRLGAADILLWPARDAEVLSVVERVLAQGSQVYARRRLDEQLKEANEELQRKVRELTSIVSIGKAVVSMTDRRLLLERIMGGALSVAAADLGWLLLRDERSGTFVLTAYRNLPDAWAKRIGQPVDDGISSLVSFSGESLLIHGEPLKKFKIATLGKSVAVVPIKIKKEVIGVMVIVRRSEKAFGGSEQTLLEVMADYASISLVNERLFHTIEQNAEAARAGEKKQNALLRSLRETVEKGTRDILHPLELTLSGKAGKLTSEQRQILSAVQAAVRQLAVTVKQTGPEKQA